MDISTSLRERNNLIDKYIERTKINVDSFYMKVPENAKYLSDFLDDLPYDCFFNKVVTGCGGTTLALTNKENYVVAVHSLNVVKNKSEQHSNILGVHGEMSNDSIIKYLFDYADKPKKFIVTYDSLPRLIDVLEECSIGISDFRLLVDEVQVLIRNLGEFKIEVSNNLLNNVYKFKSVCYLTATPTDEKYLPEPIKKLKYIELEWNNLKNVHINHCHVSKQFQTKVFTHIMDKLDHTDDDIYIFYNSKAGVVTIIEKILSVNFSLINDIEIIFADNDGNLKYFKRMLTKSGFKNIKLGYDLKVDSIGNPVDSNRKRIKFISSFGFEGVDFYSFGRDVTTIIAADSVNKSMRYDISIDIPQILGRVRRDKTTGKFPKNDIYFIWKTMAETVYFNTQDEIFNYIASKSVFCNEMLKNAKLLMGDNEKSKTDASNILRHTEPYLINIGNGDFIENTYVMEGIMSTFAATHYDYNIVLNDVDRFENVSDDSVIVRSISDISTSLSNFKINDLNPIYSKNLERRVSFYKACTEYHELYKKYAIDNSIEISDEMELMRKSHDLLDEALDYMSISDLEYSSYKSTTIKNKINDIKTFNKIKNEIGSKYKIFPGDVYSMEELLEISAKIIKDYNLRFAPKCTFLNNIFTLKRRRLKNGFEGYKLEEKK